jgi:hypothetical protein
MESVNRLADIGARIREIQDLLRSSEPELFEELDLLNAEKTDVIERAKIELRDRGAGSYTVGNYQFKVTPGGTKKEYRIDEIQELAEELGHTEVLTNYRVLKLTVDPSQIERLPPELKVHYEKLCDVTTQTARVTLPKDLG